MGKIPLSWPPNLDAIKDLRIVENEHLLTVVQTTVVRTWRERLFSRPWRPRARTKIVNQTIPTMEIFQTKHALIMHPLMAVRFRAYLRTQRQMKEGHQ